MGKQIKVAKQVIASQTKIAAQSLKEMNAAMEANQMEIAADAAQRLIAADVAANDAAKAAGFNLSKAQLTKLGYVSPSAEEGEGFIELPIPVAICKILAARSKN